MLQRTYGLLTAVAAIAVIWPFFQYPGTMFYNRYSEAWLFLNPQWLLASYFGGWSYYQHLGYPTLTETVYLSVQTLVVTGIHAIAGTAVTSKIYPALIQLWLLFSFLFFARKKFPQLSYGIALLAALFFTVNPITAAAIHEGYSGMLVDYGLFPWTLLLVDYAVERNTPALLAVIPLLYTLTSMFKFPEVAINLAALLVFRGRAVFALLRTSRSAIGLLVVAFCLNFYWVLPIAFNAATHRSLPIQADTQSEIAVTTHYSSLSSVVLGRVFGIFGSDAHLCSGCSYYLGAYFNIAMLAIVVTAIIGLVRGRRWTYLGVLAACIILATGYHYQDEVIGIPYQILMGLPTMQIFRAANIFSLMAFFCYAAGLLHFFALLRDAPATRWYAAAALCAVAVAGLPLFTGSILEHGKPPAATFFVRIPAAYAQAKHALPQHSDGVTLLVPNQRFAAYRWGAAVQDFLPPYIGRPSIANWYWPQPSADTQRVLDEVTGPQTPVWNIAGALRSMRVDSVLVHNDVIGAHADPARYGSLTFSQGGVSVVTPPLQIAPMFESASTVLRAPPDSAASIAGWTGAVTATSPQPSGCGDLPSGLAPAKVSRGVATFTYALRCNRPMRIVLLAAPSARAPGIFIRARHRKNTLTVHRTAAGWETTARLPQRGTVVVSSTSVHGMLFALPGQPLPNGGSALDLRLALGAWTSLRVPADARVIVVSQSSDPSWQIVAWTGGRAHFARKFVANGYANGWVVPRGATIWLLNLAQIAFLLGCLLSLIALASGVALVAISAQRYRVRAGLAAQD
jgi:hypothetical protein